MNRQKQNAFEMILVALAIITLVPITRGLARMWCYVCNEPITEIGGGWLPIGLAGVFVTCLIFFGIHAWCVGEAEEIAAKNHAENMEKLAAKIRAELGAKTT